MDQIISDIISIAQTIILTLGLLAIYFEYRKGNRDRGYQTYLQTALSWVELQKWWANDPDAFGLWSYDQNIAKLSMAEKKRYELSAMMCVIFEIIYNAKQKGWIDKPEWEGWDAIIRELLRCSPDFKALWTNEANLFSSDFVKFMKKILAEETNQSLSKS